MLLQRLGPQVDAGDTIRSLEFVQAGDLETIIRLAEDSRWNQVIGLLELLDDDQRKQLTEDISTNRLSYLLAKAMEDQQTDVVPKLVGLLYSPDAAASMRHLWIQTGAKGLSVEHLQYQETTRVRILELEWSGKIDEAVQLAIAVGDKPMADLVAVRNGHWKALGEPMGLFSEGGNMPVELSSLSLARQLLLLEFLGRENEAKELVERFKKTDSSDLVALSEAFAASGQFREAVQVISKHAPDVAIRLYQLLGDYNLAFAVLGFDPNPESVQDWVKRNEAIASAEPSSSHILMSIHAAMLLRQLGADSDPVIEELVRYANAELPQDISRWEMLVRVWRVYDQREWIVQHLGNLLERSINQEYQEVLLETSSERLGPVTPRIARWLKRRHPERSWSEILADLSALEKSRLPVRLQDPKEFERMCRAALQSPSNRFGIRFWSDDDDDFDFGRASQVELLARLAQRVGLHDLAQRLLNENKAFSLAFVDILAARGDLESAETILKHFHTVQAPSRTWMSFQRAEWLKQMGRYEDAERVYEFGLAIPASDLLDIRQMRERGLNSPARIMAEHLLRTSLPENQDYRRGDSINDIATELAGLIEESDPEKAIQLYRIGRWYASNFPRSIFNAILHQECEALCMARLALENNHWESANSAFQRAFQIRPANIDAAIRLVPLADDKLGKEYGDRWVNQHVAFHKNHLEQWPRDAMYHNNLAWLLVKTGRELESALEHARLACELHPNEPTYIDTLAEVEYAVGNIDRAIECSLECIALNGDHKHYREQLARFASAKNGR